MTAFGVRTTSNAPDDDPYFWLGDVEGERTPAWATSQSARTLEHFGGTQFKRDDDALTTIFGRPDKILLITRRGQYLYNSGKKPEIRADCGGGPPLPRVRRSCLSPQSGTTAFIRGYAPKMPAKLQTLGYRPYFCEPGAGAHGYGKTIRSGPHSLL
ncbi:hypothetical protein OHD62_33230 [Mesorhizobium sp. YC-39]|uniref:hypothetical protein n=1 Tax=unclassified Mesorhizobium TaxID=325217 RepID=UPI0021E88C92|nr:MULTISPECIES: hypothetical protein [unclassified Mesorhizobium]MCV3211570.1 hypothetical protein [Mesorhizobium sp. YC-2]MCV3233232.1 hypothetical protein [Mesorhizobium sp. YC-39]